MLISRLLALFLVWLALPSAAGAIWPFSSTSPSPTITESSGSSAITAPEVARRAEEAGKVLRDIDALLAPGPGIVAIQDRLPDIGARLSAQGEATTRQLDEGPSGPTLDALTAQWQAVRAELATYINVLAERGTNIERGLGTLTTLHDTWTKARNDVRASKAPAQVVDRIDGILTAVANTRIRLQQERGATLVLQDHVAQHVAECDAMLDRLGGARVDVAGSLFARDGVPLWHIAQLWEAVTELPGRLRRAAEGAVTEIGQYVADERAHVVTNVLLLAILSVMTFAARRKARTSAPAGSAPRFAPLENALAAAFLLTLLGNAFFSPRPRVVQAVGEMIMLVPTVTVVRAGIDPRRVPTLYALAGLLFVDLVRRLASPVPLVEQHLLLFETVAVIAVLVWKLGLHRRSVLPGARFLQIVLVASLIAFAAAGAAGAAGYVRFAVFIGSGILGSIFVTLVLYASARVVSALIAVALLSPPLRDLRVVQYHRSLLERRIATVVRCVASVAWVVLVLRHFGLWGPATAWTARALDAEFHSGQLTISFGAVVGFAIMVAATFLLSAVIRFAVEEEIYPRLARERALPFAVSTLIHYTLVLGGFMLGLAALGVDLTKITIVAGALGVGIGFGLQGLVNNFVSGLVILSERRINVGDAVQIGDVGGRVQQMGIRACLVRTWDGAEVIVPNASLTTEKVTNWTLSDHRRRIDVPIGVAYGTSPERVADILLGVARKHADVIADPAPLVFFRGFGDSALQFELQAWTNRFERWAVARSEVAVAAYAALREASIEIPFPQRELRLRAEQPEHRPA